jgi:hypothetical protein
VRGQPTASGLLNSVDESVGVGTPVVVELVGECYEYGPLVLGLRGQPIVNHPGEISVEMPAKGRLRRVELRFASRVPIQCLFKFVEPDRPQA